MNGALVFDGGYGFDGILDYLLIDYINDLDTMDDKLAKVKSIYVHYPEEYQRWKCLCIHEGKLPDIFGTKDHPIEIDESKL